MSQYLPVPYGAHDNDRYIRIISVDLHGNIKYMAVLETPDRKLILMHTGGLQDCRDWVSNNLWQVVYDEPLARQLAGKHLKRIDDELAIDYGC